MWDVGCNGSRKHKDRDCLLPLPPPSSCANPLFRPRLVLLAPVIANQNGVCGVHQTKCIGFTIIPATKSLKR